MGFLFVYFNQYSNFTKLPSARVGGEGWESSSRVLGGGERSGSEAGAALPLRPLPRRHPHQLHRHGAGRLRSSPDTNAGSPGGAGTGLATAVGEAKRGGGRAIPLGALAGLGQPGSPLPDRRASPPCRHSGCKRGREGAGQQRAAGQPFPDCALPNPRAVRLKNDRAGREGEGVFRC